MAREVGREMGSPNTAMESSATPDVAPGGESDDKARQKPKPEKTDEPAVPWLQVNASHQAGRVYATSGGRAQESDLTWAHVPCMHLGCAQLLSTADLVDKMLMALGILGALGACFCERQLGTHASCGTLACCMHLPQQLAAACFPDACTLQAWLPKNKPM